MNFNTLTDVYFGLKISKQDSNAANQCPPGFKLFFAQRSCLVEIAQILFLSCFLKTWHWIQHHLFARVSSENYLSGSERITLKFKIALRFISSWLKAENGLSRYRLQCSTLFSENVRSFFNVGQTACKIQNTKSIFIFNFVNICLIKPKW